MIASMMNIGQRPLQDIEDRDELEEMDQKEGYFGF